MMKRSHIVAVAGAAVLAVIASVAAAGDEPDQLTSIGLSLVANSGNSESSSFGLTAEYKRQFDPWALKVWGLAIKSSSGGDTTAERYAAAARAELPFSDAWTAFAGLSGERDRFAGYNLRGIVEAGAILKYLEGPVHTLSFDAGLTWTREDVVQGENRDFLGALLGASYGFQFSETSSLTERLLLYPNFDESSDWRATSETSLQASLSATTALKLAVLFRYDNEPVSGFEKTDTTTMASVVVKF